MAENKFVVKTVFHDENGDTLLREDYRETREKAQELKDLANFGYAGLFGKGQRTLIPVIRSVKHISTCGESTELNHGAHF